MSSHYPRGGKNAAAPFQLFQRAITIDWSNPGGP